MVPVVQALKVQPGVRTTLCVTAQHRKMLDQVLSIAGLTPDIDLALMLPNQSLGDLLARMVTAVGMVLDRERPDRVLVHGDTMTAFATALSATLKSSPTTILWASPGVPRTSGMPQIVTGPLGGTLPSP